jgi:hypothetical protein
LWEEYIHGVLAHEFQHMIHWNLDSNEESWLNEGFSELASLLNGYNPGGFDTFYLMNTDLQLNEWPNDSSLTSPHYGSSFLFVTYFLDRFGEEMTKQVIRSEENGFESIDQVLEDAQITDNVSGQLITADDVFVDWSLTNYLQDQKIADGRYDYRSYEPDMVSTISNFNSTCSPEWLGDTVQQYGVDMIELNCSGNTTLEFDGNNVVNIIPADAFSGNYAFWSNKGDDSDMTLTKQFDFSEQSGRIEMNYFTWFDLEVDYDYVYVLTSLDGEHWQFVNTAMGTDSNPVGNNLGWGYNATTEGWLQESIDLSEFAGEKVYVRFEYITDAAVNGEGFLVDDISIPVLDYFEDFEADDGGWLADGFVRTQNRLPQTFRVTVITETNDPTIRKYQVDAGQNLTIDLDFAQNSPLIVFISGTTRYTRQPAVYRYRFIN